MRCVTLALVSTLSACSANTSEPPAAASSIGSLRADFTRYRTFTFGPANPPAAGYQVTPRSLEVLRRLAPIVQASLEKRGYTPSSEGDLIVKISAGTDTNAGERLYSEDPPRTFVGFIGLDAYDRVTGATIWHGTGTAEVEPELVDDRLLTRGVERMLSNFPARGQSSAPTASAR
jgi:hypothetical protein